MVVHGLWGPSLAPKNLATTLTWVHFRGVLVLALLCAGNFFCMACPFILVRDFARKFFRPRLTWPRKLRSKWISVVLFLVILYCYELFSLWSTPWWTAWLIVIYFAFVVVIDSIFKHATFCKFLCPIGQFNFIASTMSPLEIRTRKKAVCGACKTNDCIRGRREAKPTAFDVAVIQRGCELALFQPSKVGNMDCTFCLDCVHACPHDNIGIMGRPPASELMTDQRRSGIGFFSRRKDLSALALVFTFGALMNAFGMVSPVYTLEKWLSDILHVHYEAPILALLFCGVVVVEPLVLLGLAGWVSRAWGGVQRGLLPLVVRYSYALVPLGFGMWLAHYGFHLLTGLYTVVPLTQNVFASLGMKLLGEPRWTLVGLPLRVVQPLEFGFLVLGLIGSLTVTYRLAQDDREDRPVPVFIPWAVLCVVLFVAALWLIGQPMDMRATFLE
jgi:hypothetical protein